METENTQQTEQIKTGARNERKIEDYKGDVIMDENEKIQIILSWTRNEFKEGAGTGVYMKPSVTCVNMECPKIRLLKFWQNMRKMGSRLTK
ncbi:hypothetical protein BFINE_08680 [Bacteroides finegoldii DSM 17565]|nr:hypothetical protein BFINE_08680 [Bacteroides finegoldii DSM 17565]